MKKFFALALVAGVAQVVVMRAQTASQSEVVKADEAFTRALLSGDRAAAEKMLDADFSWIDPDGVYYATKGEAFAHNVKPLVGTGADVKVIEHRYGKLVYVERSEGEKKFSAHFWAQRPNGWRLLHVNDLEVRQRDYQTVPTTFNVPCTNPCQVLPYRPLGAGEKSALEAWQEQESGSAGWGKRVADNLDQRAVNTYGGRSASKKDRYTGMLRGQQQNPNRPQVGAAPVAYGRAWDFGESVLWVQLQPTYGDKPYWSSRVYANINGLWQMAESYHTYIKDAPVMAPVPESATKKSATN
ncbi:MAG TPA: nuclear transport factor 2 family protein [Vicinamibacterales bacterium]|jgi:hypothetical protein